MGYLLRHASAALVSGLCLLLAAGPSQAREDFWKTVNESRQLFEIKEYEQAQKRLELARRLARGEEQSATVSLYEGLVLASLGRRNQEQAALAFRAALSLDPWAKLRLKVSARVAREFEEVRVRVRNFTPPPPQAAPSPSAPAQENFGRGKQAIQQFYDSREYEQALKELERARQLVRNEEHRVTVMLYEGVILASLGEQQLARAASSFKEGLLLASWAKLPVKVSPLVERDFEEAQRLANKELEARVAVSPDDKATWKTTGSMSKAREAHTATLLIASGKVLVTGGADAGGSLAEAELYDPQAGTWSSTDSMSTARYHHTATYLKSGKVLVVGGENDDHGVLSSSEEYEPESGTWSPTDGSMLMERHHHTATLLDSGKVLVVGGADSSGDRLASAEIYDPEKRTWTFAGVMSTDRIYHTAILLPSGKVLVLGGIGTNGYLSSAEVYDPATGTWSLVEGGLPMGLSEHKAVMLRSGKVLVVGGGDGGTVPASATLYDPRKPQKEAWTPVNTNMGTGRIAHTVTELPQAGNKVLVTGGDTNRSQVPARAELYDPFTGKWAPTANMTTLRSSHTATLLPSGAVLIVGGNDDKAPLNSAEIYQP